MKLSDCVCLLQECESGVRRHSHFWGDDLKIHYVWTLRHKQHRRKALHQSTILSKVYLYIKMAD